MPEQVLFITNEDSFYPLASLADGNWSISESFSHGDFNEWIKKQVDPGFMLATADQTLIEYTVDCPKCGAVDTIAEEIDSVITFKCQKCGETGTIDMENEYEGE